MESLAQLGILYLVSQERRFQDQKWGTKRMGTTQPEHWYTVLGEEVGEVARAILEHDIGNYRDELVQVAAVAVAALESLDLQMRGENDEPEVQQPEVAREAV